MKQDAKVTLPVKAAVQTAADASQMPAIFQKFHAVQKSVSTTKTAYVKQRKSKYAHATQAHAAILNVPLSVPSNKSY